MSSDPAIEVFLRFSHHKLLEQYWPRLRKAVEPLSDEQIWWRPNEASNSIGNLILHLNGNVWQWLVASFNRLEDSRDRPAEFNATGDLSAADLLAGLAGHRRSGQGVGRHYARGIAGDVDIQGYTVSGTGGRLPSGRALRAALRPDLYITKMQEGRDLGFYRELGKTGRATGGSV